MTTKKKKPTLDEIIADASPVERVVSLCVAGKLVAEHEQLEAELEQLATEPPAASARLGATDNGATRVAKQLRALEERMRDSTYEFRFRALPRKRWSDLLAEHADKAGKYAFDRETFPPAAIAACCVEPEGMDDPEKVAELMGRLSSAQQADLFECAWEVNSVAPKGTTSFAAYAALRASEPSLNTAQNGESPEASS